MSIPVTLTDIRAARQRIGDAVYHSPCPYSLQLSRICNHARIYCKLDHLQVTGSFKERGARNKLMLLTAEQRQAGVIAASAGNHALGLAYHGQQLGIPVTVVMPKWAPLIKLTNCRSFRANVILHGDTYADAGAHARALAKEQHLTFVHGFDDPDIIAGQGTMGLEILEDVPDVDAVIVPVGGGGLIAGVALAIKSLRPQVRIIGVEPRNAPTMYQSLQQGHVTPVDTRPTLADGLAIARAGQLPFEIARQLVERIVLVDEPQIATAVLRLLELQKTVVEGASAVPLIAAMDPSLHLESKKVVLCLAGGNIDLTLLSHIIERGLATDGRLCRITAHVSDRPGSLAHLLSIIADTGASVKEVFHDRSFGPPDVGTVAISCIMETRDLDHVRQIGETLRSHGINFRPAGREPEPGPA
jgi:threonine dehydratase